AVLEVAVGRRGAFAKTVVDRGEGDRLREIVAGVANRDLLDATVGVAGLGVERRAVVAGEEVDLRRPGALIEDALRERQLDVVLLLVVVGVGAAEVERALVGARGP